MALAAEPTGWWMYHGDAAHTGRIGPGESRIDAAALAAGELEVLHTLRLGGPILSVPAVSDGFVYVGLANTPGAAQAQGGRVVKIALETGEVAAQFSWKIDPLERDTHGFCGMGVTPAVVGARVYFAGFNAKLYCLDAADLRPIWTTDLRNQDLAHNQPVQTFDPGDDINNEAPPAAGWSSPLVVGERVYLGIGEGENPDLFSFVFCLDAASGDVVWIFCTNQYASGYINQPNELPASVLLAPPPAPFTVRTGEPITKGCSVWGSIAYDATLDRLYCPVGNGVPDGPVPTPGWSNGLLSLDAKTGAFRAYFQIPPESNYRDTDIDVDVGASPVLFTGPDGRRVVAVGCKNGTFFVLDADSLAHVASRQLLPKFVGGGLIPTVDPNPNDPQANTRVLKIAQRAAAADDAENYSGIYSTAAVDPQLGRLFVGVGGNNYHPTAPGIDTESTPFLRALDWTTLADAWPVEERPYLGGTIQRYARSTPPLYANLSESGLSSPAVVNGVVFMATTWVSLYAFSAHDGALLFEDRLGQETGALNGGYGYCMGPAVCGDYVVAGALVFGGDGGVLRIYRLKPRATGG
ncbi:MAG TPA: PQQ-binding-like beta-propeller repeat protein [Caulobacteraceae bacterium]|jgi:outer membrane protein assembly factor BamB